MLNQRQKNKPDDKNKGDRLFHNKTIVSKKELQDKIRVDNYDALEVLHNPSFW